MRIDFKNKFPELSMREIEPPFGLEFDGHMIRISGHELQGKRVFHVDFKDSEKHWYLLLG